MQKIDVWLPFPTELYLHIPFPLKKGIAKKSFQDPQGSNQQNPVKIISNHELKALTTEGPTVIQQDK